MDETRTRTALSITIPTYNRPELFERALASALQATPNGAGPVEVVVSDNSTDDRTQAVFDRVAADQPGTRYVRNDPPVGPVANFNRCRELARGKFVLILHDDDFLLPGAVDAIIATVAAPDAPAVVLFGTHVVDAQERVRKRQVYRRRKDLEPREALRRVLRNSSLVRFPALVVRRDAYEDAGPFDEGAANATDFDMWIRLFSRYGVRLEPAVTCAYTVHEGALTAKMFVPESVRTIMRIFDGAAKQGVLGAAEVRRREADFFHQFILAAAYRRLRSGDPGGARTALQLFEMPEVKALGRSLRWAPVRAAFTAVTIRSRPAR